MSSDPRQPAVSPGDLVRTEAAALLQLAERLDGPERPQFEAALNLLEATAQSGGKCVLTGAGKSGLIARKIAATLLSAGVNAAFLHPSEALHGDLGMIRPGDLLLALSYSGETEELLRLLPFVQQNRIPLICLTGCGTSSLARTAQLTLNVSIEREACTHDLMPTASTTTMLALGDALAVALSQRLGFVPQTFAHLHPGGQLGRRLVPVAELMHSGDRQPVVTPDAPVPVIVHEMSAKRLGMTTVQNASGKLAGVLSDGDLRRLFERDGPEAFHRVAAEVMNPHPHTVRPDLFAGEALELMEQHKITALVVTSDGTPQGLPQGVVHMHDLLQTLAVTSDTQQPPLQD